MSDCQSCGHCLGGTFCYFPQEDVHGNHAAQWRTGGCPACAERAAIVAWLRAKAERAFLGERDPQDSLVGDFATWIERGEHLRGADA